MRLITVSYQAILNLGFAIHEQARQKARHLDQIAKLKAKLGAVEEPKTTSNGPKQAAELLKAKQGLIGFANGFNTAAMADTGSRKNVMSVSYARKLNLTIEGSPSMFKIGSSRKIQSIGKSRPRGLRR